MSTHEDRNRDAFNEVAVHGMPAELVEDNERNNKTISEAILKQYTFNPNTTVVLDYACGTGAPGLAVIRRILTGCPFDRADVPEPSTVLQVHLGIGHQRQER